MKQARAGDARRLFQARGTRAWLDLLAEYGQTFRLQGTIFTCDPELVRTILMGRPHTEHRSKAHRFINKVTPGSSGILFMEGEQWLRHLKALTPAFQKRHIDSFPEMIQRSTKAAAQRWASEGEVPDLFTAVTQLGLEHVLRIGYGLDPAHPLVAELSQELAGYKMATMTPDPRPRLDLFAITPGKARHLPRTAGLMLDLRRRMKRIYKLVQAILDDPATRLTGRRGWIEGLAAEHLPLRELGDEVNHVYGAYNAVDYVITAGLLELARHPDWHERLRRELDAHLDERAFPTRDDVPRLPDSANFLREVLRLYPVAMCIFRQTGAPLSIDGEELPSGTQIAALPYALHRRSDIWADGDEFEPDRWGSSGEPPVPFSYVPFLDGARKCIGRDLAELEFLVVVSTLVREFELEVLGTEADVLPFIIPRFDRPLPFRVRARV